jgi:chaperone modulatory protein CbpM
MSIPIVAAVVEVIEVVEASEILWLDECHEFSLTEFAGLSSLSPAELQTLVDCEALLPVAAIEPAAAPDAAQVRYSAQSLPLARTASRLRNDFDLDANGLTLTVRLLKRIHELETELRDLHAQLPQSRSRSSGGTAW